MAIEICLETSSSSPSWSLSPRISFSHDLSQTENIPIDRHRLDSSLLDSSSPDFDFCITDPCEEVSSSADELFSNGKILPLPIQIQSKTTQVFTLPNAEIPQPKSNPPQSLLPPRPPPPQNQKKESLKEIMEVSKPEEKPNSKSFWGFTRSSSLNCASSYKRSLICSLPPLLSRSNSTGSTNPNPNPRGSQLKDSWKSSQKPPLKKNNSSGRNLYGSQSNGGVRINPILNVQIPCISKGTTSLFSFFITGKSTKNKKKSSSVPHPSHWERI
ncbi:uncharacterized protein LOC143854322 [Tasmannia lanceolata]|uniref:uncharacterized protein LOC143854322 n=1 Tax=Tasmannia lanceolata TaxID=3420 RepID=UPI00406413DF